LAENAQEFIFVYIPKKNTGNNPLRQKKIGRTTFLKNISKTKHQQYKIVEKTDNSAFYCSQYL
jgi:hypothetical protein